MNHRTPIEDFRARIAALSREQLIEAMHYLRGYNSFAMDRALELVAMPALCTARRLGDDYFTIYYCKLANDGHAEHLARQRHEGDPDITWTDAPAVLARVHVHLFGQDGICTMCDIDIVTWSQAQGDAELDHIAIEGTLS